MFSTVEQFTSTLVPCNTWLGSSSDNAFKLAILFFNSCNILEWGHNLWRLGLIRILCYNLLWVSWWETATNVIFSKDSKLIGSAFNKIGNIKLGCWVKVLIDTLPYFKTNFSLFNPVSLDPRTTIIFWFIPRKIDKVSSNGTNIWFTRCCWWVMRWLSSDRIDTIKWRSISINIGGQDAEEIFLAFGKTLHWEGCALTETCNYNPFIVSNITPLNNIVSDLGSSIKVRSTPVKLACMACDFRNL